MIEIYTDGGCSKNGSKDAIGAIGVVLIQDGVIKFEHTQTYLSTTNNRMEYRALILAMQLCIKNNIADVTFNTDSNLLVETITKWMFGWEKNGWKKKSSPKKIKNLDLVLHLWELKQQLPHAQFKWVKGHADNVYNNRADELATAFDMEHAARDDFDMEILNKYHVASNLAR